MICGFFQFSLVETVITSVFDEFPHLFQKRWRKYAFRALWCFVGFLLGFPFLTQVSDVPLSVRSWDCLSPGFKGIVGCNLFLQLFGKVHCHVSSSQIYTFPFSRCIRTNISKHKKKSKSRLKNRKSHIKTTLRNINVKCCETQLCFCDNAVSAFEGHAHNCLLFQGGAYLLDLIDNSILGYPSLVVGLCELLILGYIYGEVMKVRHEQ